MFNIGVEVVVGVEEESMTVLTPWDMVMVTVESPPAAALMLKGWEYWKTSGLAALEMERPYLASSPSLESTSHEYVPAALSIPAVGRRGYGQRFVFARNAAKGIHKKLTGNLAERNESGGIVAAEELNVDLEVLVLVGYLPGNLKGLAGSDILVLLRLGDGVEAVGGILLGNGRGGESQESGSGEAHLDSWAVICKISGE